MTNPQVSIYNGVHDTYGVIIPFDGVIQRIKSGNRGLQKKTQDLNKWYHENPVKYKARKEELPTVTWSGTFPKGKRHHKNLIQHSGYVVLDVEPKLDFGTVLADFRDNPHVRFAFVSPSGHGVKPIIPVSPIPRSPAEHKAAFRAILKAFHEYAEADPVELTKQYEANRLCFLAWDPRPIDNPNAIPIEWELEDVETPEHTQPPIVLSQEQTANIDAFSKKHNIVFDANGKSQYFPKSSCINAATHKSNNKAVQFFRNHDGSVNGFCNGCKAHWYVVQPLRNRNRKPVRLHKKTDAEFVFEPLMKSREVLKKAFDAGAKFIGVRADTGVGKNEQAKDYYLKGAAGFVSTPSTDLAKEFHQRLQDAEVNSFRWRGVGSEPDGQFPHEKACGHDEEYIALSEKGRNPVRIKCEGCEFLDECLTHGYRSQEEKAKEADVVVAPHKDLLMNPTFLKTAKRILPSHEDDLITIDEFDIINSFIEVELTQARLEYLRDSWKGYALGEFAKDLLDAIVVQDAPFTGIGFIVDTLSEDEREEIIEQLGQLCVNGKVMDADDIEEWELGTGQLNGVDKIKQLPVLERDEKWNLLVKLELFFDIYKHAETAPMTWEDNTLKFFLPPLPTYTEARVILMSATLSETFFRQVFRSRQEKRDDVEFVDLVNTEWHKDARVFQLQTNRNPRRTLLEGAQDDETGKWKYTNELTKTGQGFMDRIKTSIDQSKKKSGFIGHKSVVDTHTADWEVPTANFGGLVGLNERFYRNEDAGILLHILGTPNVGQEAVHTAAKLLYGMTSTPLDFTRNDDGTYDDPSVQAVADAIVQDEMIQAVGRAGLVKNPSDVVIWSSYEIPSITHRDQTLLFTEADWENADGDFDQLPGVVASRKAHDKAVADAIEKGDAKAVAELKGVSQGHARKITQEPKKNQRMELARQVSEMIDSGMSQRAVETELKISRKKITKLLNEYKAVHNAHGHVYNTHVDARYAPPPETPVTTDVAKMPSETTAKAETHKDPEMDHEHNPYDFLTMPAEDLPYCIEVVNNIQNDENHPDREWAQEIMNNLGTILHKRFGNGDDTTHYDTRVKTGDHYTVFSGGLDNDYQNYLKYKETHREQQ